MPPHPACGHARNLGLQSFSIVGAIIYVTLEQYRPTVLL
jgi:hypothetical protein